MFLKARMALADVYLQHRNDHAAYVRCYAELAEQHGDAASHRLLGEALMRVQEPERAIKVSVTAVPHGQGP